ncbi:hypothetical protein [Haloplanus halobius]|uniref:hypothetical protein n=1 Tax=Haloplanus halobius TaxID=2934938 RepID=UPI00200FFCAD|nr:hypothetical protein [Haloplanus sp. XH21]
MNASDSENILSVLNNHHDYFKTSSKASGTNSDLNILSDIDSVKTLNNVLGGPRERYGRVRNEFAIVDRNQQVIFDEDWSTIHSTKNPLGRIRTIIEGELRKKLAENGMAMVHGSAVNYEGNTYLFPAWRHTGKTNVMLTLMQNGADYLGDDRVFISEGGEIYAFPTNIHLFSYNYNSFDDIRKKNSVSKSRVKLKMWIGSITSKYSNKVSKGIDIFNNVMIGEEDWVDPLSLFPDSYLVEKDSVDEVIMLQSSENTDVPSKTPIESGELIRALTGINHVEWNSYLQEVGLAHDILFPNRASKEKELELLKEKEENIFSNFSKKAKIRKLLIKPEEYWGEEFKKDIVSEIEY